MNTSKEAIFYSSFSRLERVGYTIDGLFLKKILEKYWISIENQKSIRVLLRIPWGKQYIFFYPW